MGKLKVLATELSIFLAVQLLGLYTAAHLLSTQSEIYLNVPELSILSFAASFILAVTIIFMAIKFLKGKFGFKLLFVFLIVVGSKTIFSAMFSDFVSTILALVVVALWVGLPYVLMHNLAIVLAISGISAELGFAVSFTTILVLMAVLSIYDVLAVYQTKHMITMFKDLMDRGVVLSIIIPIKFQDFLKRTDIAHPKKGFMFLGTGDLAFPLIFAISALKFSMHSSLFIIGGATVGAALVFYLLVNQTQRRALPALPPIAICSFVGFVLSLII
jgi:presenilin-like A22 family membrane protease